VVTDGLEGCHLNIGVTAISAGGLIIKLLQRDTLEMIAGARWLGSSAMLRRGSRLRERARTTPGIAPVGSALRNLPVRLTSFVHSSAFQLSRCEYSGRRFFGSWMSGPSRWGSAASVGLGSSVRLCRCFVVAVAGGVVEDVL
jgi:hypothetical protein